MNFGKDHPTEISKACELVAEASGRFFSHLGYRALVGKVWALLILAPNPADAAELKKTLEVSTGALSMALNDLVGLGLAYRETGEGTRRFLYRAETDLWIIATRIYREKERKKLESLLGKIKEAEQLFSKHSASSGTNRDTEYKLEQVRRLSSLGEFVIGLMDAVMERTSVELKATRKWLSVSGRLGGEPLSRIRRAINASRMERRKRS